MKVYPYYLDGERHLSEQILLTGRQLLERTHLPSKGRVLFQVEKNNIQVEDELTDSTKIDLSAGPVPHFMTLRRDALIPRRAENYEEALEKEFDKVKRNDQLALQLTNALTPEA